MSISQLECGQGQLKDMGSEMLVLDLASHYLVFHVALTIVNSSYSSGPETSGQDSRIKAGLS
jgi:hypothetical protein